MWLVLMAKSFKEIPAIRITIHPPHTIYITTRINQTEK